MNTNTNTNSVPANVPAAVDNAKLLSVIGLKFNPSAKGQIERAGGFVPEGASETLVACAASVVKNAKDALSAGRKTALALAVIERTEEYKVLKGPNGKPFKSASALFAALFPTLAESTVRNYLNAGRTVYLPYAEGKLEPDFAFLNNLEPGTVLSMCGALNDAEARKALPAVLKENKTADKPTQAAVKKAAKEAREAAKPDTKKEDGTKGTESKDAKAAADTAAEELRVAIRKVFAPDFIEGELHLTVGEDRVKAYKALLAEACKSPDNALAFCKAFGKACGVK